MRATDPVHFKNRDGAFPVLSILLSFSVLVLVLRHGFDYDPASSFVHPSPELGVLLCILEGYFVANVCHGLYLCDKKVICELWKTSRDRIFYFLFSWDFCCVIFTGTLVSIYRHHASFTIFVSALIVILSVRFLFPLHRVEVLSLRETWKLSPGYLAANYYYFNYLKLFVPFIFEERVKEFSRRQEVDVIEKLFVLVPKSCEVKTYLDGIELIERARELPTFTLNIAGTKDRVYNITVYQVIRNLETYDSYWCCVEFAQPLRQLWHLFKDKKLSENELHQELVLFVQTLFDLLKDENDSYKVCELLFYDDNTTDVVDILLTACDES